MSAYHSDGNGRGGAMERGLHERDRVGVQDFVLLEDYQNEKAFVDNLRKRFKENLIYTYIGQVLVSVNPYKELPIYTDAHIKEYENSHFYEAPPHVFAVTNTAYKSLKEEHREQCILISGESGSGKTEASKKVLQFIAAISGHVKKVETVKDKLLQSNPVLEAFGNARTNRNDNSSRFGKYMDIQFDRVTGDPAAGNILNYLLEKSRVIHQTKGERNFHIFYQLLAGATDDELAELHLKRNLDTYYYLSDGAKGRVEGIDDSDQFRQVKRAMSIIELSENEQKDIFNIVASVLHMGNIGFTEKDGQALVLKPESIENIAKLLGCSPIQLRTALTNRTIEARGDSITTPLSRDMAIYARDALAKAVYDRLFTWLVSRLNESLQSGDQINEKAKRAAMGILDIYGFEIFDTNSFEQFCINYCNEKLQQLFIELTLRSEQEEYLKEGIEWVPVEYFDNKVICDLIEAKHRGLIAYMDEECLRPGDPTDMTLLSKLNDNLFDHPHYISHRKADLKTQKTLGRDEFRLVHYAGDVTYNVNGFLEKNNDLLFRDLREVMASTTNNITRASFAVQDQLDSKRRPDTAVTQFKASLSQLMDILMVKEPSYIRCIKPNDDKRSSVFDDVIVTHQVKYLGLMENLRVRRAGFAYRRPYSDFLQRYKCLSPSTWPNYPGPAKEGVQTLVCSLGYEKDEYRMGNTKIFIRFPKTLFDTEDAFQVKKNDIAAKIQAAWKGRVQRQKYLRMKMAAIIMEKHIRRFLAKKELERRKKAANVIRNFIKGFITRNDAPNECNIAFIELAKTHWLNRLAKQLPKNLLDSHWPIHPIACKDTSDLLRRIYRLHLARVYRKALTPERKKQLDLKVLAESLFKDKKKSYKSTISEWFKEERLSSEQVTVKNAFISSSLGSGEKVRYSTPIVKYDRHGYKPRDRVLLLTNQNLYILEEKKVFKTKHKLPLGQLGYVITNENDNLCIIRIPSEFKKDKGDLIIEVPHLIEMITLLVDVTKNQKMLQIMDTKTIEHNMKNGKHGVVEISTGTPATIHKAKSGNLMVVASP